MNNSSAITLSNLDRDLITVSKKSNFLYKEHDAFYKYRWVVADYIGFREDDVSNALLIRKVGNTFNKLLKLGHIELPSNFDSIDEFYFNLLTNHKSFEDLLNTFIAGIEWIEISESDIENLLNLEL